MTQFPSEGWITIYSTIFYTFWKYSYVEERVWTRRECDKGYRKNRGWVCVGGWEGVNDEGKRGQLEGGLVICKLRTSNKPIQSLAKHVKLGGIRLKDMLINRHNTNFNENLV